MSEDAPKPVDAPKAKPDGVAEFKSAHEERARARRGRMAAITLDSAQGKPVSADELLDLGAEPAVFDALLRNARHRARREQLLADGGLEKLAEKRKAREQDLAKLRDEKRALDGKLELAELARRKAAQDEIEGREELKPLAGFEEAAERFVLDGTLPA